MRLLYYTSAAVDTLSFDFFKPIKLSASLKSHILLLENFAVYPPCESCFMNNLFQDFCPDPLMLLCTLLVTHFEFV